MISFQYVPLTFIRNRVSINRQLSNTSVFKVVLNEFKTLKPLSRLLISTQYGYTASAKKSGNHRLLRITDIDDGQVNWERVPLCECDKPDKYLLKQGDILIARTGNNISYQVQEDVPDNALFASYLIRLKCDTEELLPDYLYLFLNSYAFWSQILKKQRGAILQNVNAKLMGELLIPYCSIEKQREIVSGLQNEFSKTIEYENNKILYIHNSISNNNSELIHQLDLLKQLRQQILQEAIQGKLVPQDPEDEPASKLLERIRAGKEKLIQEKKIKKGTPLPPIKPVEMPFEIPENWVWCRLGEAGVFKRGKSKHRPRNDERLFSDGIYPLVQTGDVSRSKGNGFIINSYTSKYNDIGLAQSHLWSAGTFCITIAANIAEVGFLGFDACVPDSVVTFESNDLFQKKYLQYYFQITKEEIQRFAPATAQKNINLGIIDQLVFPLPPAKEQNRIVTKIEQLMTLSDELEQSIQQNKKYTKELLQIALKEALEPSR